jgi:protein-tyrosine phosphatase
MATQAILFVCTGNICRSPTAAGFLRYAVGKDYSRAAWRIDSAGISHAHQGQNADPRSQQFALTRGVDLGDHRARGFKSPQDFEKFDYILGMDHTHTAWLRRAADDLYGATPLRLAQIHAKIMLFLDFHPDPALHGQDVPDPYGGPLSGFGHVVALIEETTTILVAL